MKNRDLEERQKKRFLQITIEKSRDIERDNQMKLYEGMSSTTTALLEQEESHGKELLNTLVRNSKPSDGPVVKVLTNVQGNNYITYFLLSNQ